jgi:NADP-dependent 3-hydroxy acid dehydrogenase YdfG
MNLAGQVALVTGAGSRDGIGFAAARAPPTASTTAWRISPPSAAGPWAWWPT